MNTLQHVNAWATGKKTYLISIAAVVYAWGIGKGLWDHSGLIDTALGAGGVAALRHGLTTTIARVAAAAMADPPKIPTLLPAAPGGAAVKAGFARLSLLLSMAGLSLALVTIGCAGFANNAQKSIYTASMLSDGAMKSYAVYWKDATNRLGDTPVLELERSNVMVISFKVGASINTADRTLQVYQGNVGTNTATKDVVNALIATAVQQAGSLAADIGLITGNTNLTSLGQ
jgi:hypothetical protein